MLPAPLSPPKLSFGKVLGGVLPQRSLLIEVGSAEAAQQAHNPGRRRVLVPEEDIDHNCEDLAHVAHNGEGGGRDGGAGSPGKVRHGGAQKDRERQRHHPSGSHLRAPTPCPTVSIEKKGVGNRKIVQEKSFASKGSEGGD